MPLATLSRLLFDIYDTEDEPSLDFRTFVIERVREAVPFTSGVWASGSMTPGGPDFHTITLWRQPRQMLIDYEAIKHLDPLFVESAQKPGRAVRATARNSLPPAFMPFVDRYRLEQAMSTMYVDPRSSLLTGISVWRSSPTEPFSDADAAMMEAVFPHVMEAASRRVLADLERGDIRTVPVTSRAAVDRRGRLHCADTRFAGILTREFPRWKGPDLPEPLLAAARAGESRRVVLRRITVSLVTHDELLSVRVRPRSVIDDLTDRQREIVELGALGLNHKEIALRFRISPTTARNHLANAYATLGVTNRVELVRLLQRFA